MASISDLTQLKQIYDSLVQNDSTLTLSPDNCEIESLANFLTNFPDQKFVFNPANIAFSSNQNQLLVSGNTSQLLRVLGWGSKGIDLLAIELSFSKINSEIDFTLTLHGSITLESMILPLVGILTDEKLLNFTLHDSTNTSGSLTEIANFVTHHRIERYLPTGIDIFSSVPFSQLKFSFGFAKSDPSTGSFSSDIGVDWPIIEDKIVLKNVGLSLFSSTRYAPAGNLVESFGGNIHGTLLLGEEFTIRLALNGPGNWMLELIPKDGNILPGLHSLAEFVGGADLKQSVQTGSASYGLEAISLDYVGLGIDIQPPRLKNAMISGHLTFYDLTFSVNSYLPEFSFYGGLSPQTPIHLKALIAKFFVGADAFPAVDVTRLDIGIQPKVSTFSLRATIESDWMMQVGGTSIGFKKFEFDIRKRAKEATGSIRATFNFLGADFEVGAQHPAADAGWYFFATSLPGDPIKLGELITQIGDEFGTSADLPHFLTDLEFDQFQLTFDTATKDFLFLIEAKFPIGNDNQKLDATFTIELTHNNDSYTRKLGGAIKVADLEFDLIFQQEQAADTIFLAAYENRAGKDQSIKSLAELITDDSALLDVAEGITFNLKDALLIIDKVPAIGNTPAETKLLFGLDIGSGLDISKLPLVGKSFPAGSTVQVKLQPLLTNKNFSATELGKVRPLVPAGGYNLPQSADKRIDLNIQLLIGKETIDLSLPISIDGVKGQPASTASPVSSTLSTANNSATVAPPAADNVKWFPIQKQLGPVNFGRIGVQYKNGEITLLLDASISLAGLNLSVDGLFVRSKLNPLHPAFGLHGMGIDYSKGPLEIGGAFLRQTLTDPQGNSYDSYDGTAIIRTPSFALAALGSYAYYQGHPSLFIYAFLDAPIGGPPFFFVTGLAAGFGYNRRLVMPTINQVNTFPLVAEAMSGVPGTTNDLGAEIQKLHSVIPPSIGDYFLAIGIRFTSFEIIDSFVLLAVSFGNDFEVDVLGLSTLVIPTPEEGDAIEPLAEIQLALSAVFNPGKGYLKVRAALTSASFILSRNCHLTGGFAFYTWFKNNPAEGASAGDFVLTVGGYHPRFKPPGYYPKVAPLGFNWQVTRELVLKGDFYFALVPSAVMAGGHLSATWISGNLKAWFRLGADFIISWKPYFYDASMYLGMGVSYTYHFFGTHHISVDVGADLHIWGPEFSGVAHVHLWIVSFTVRFGAHTNPEKPALTWPQFHDAFLPDNSKWEALTVAQGLVKQLGTEERPIYIINPKDFKLETSSALPITSSNQSLGDANTNIHVGSMKITDPITTVHNVSISYESVDPQTGAKTWQSVTDDFIFEPVKKHVPGAVWGDKFKHSENETDDKRLIKNACTGFTVSGKPIIPSEQSHSVLTKNLLNTEEPFLPTISIGDAAEVGDDWLQSNNLELESKAAERHALLHDLGFLDNYFPNNELAEEFILTTG